MNYSKLKIALLLFIINLILSGPAFSANGYEQTLDCTNNTWANKAVTGLIVKGVGATPDSITLEVIPTMADDKCTPKLGVGTNLQALSHIELFYDKLPGPKDRGAKVEINKNKDGEYKVVLKNLEPATKYFFDACMISDKGDRSCAIHPSPTFDSDKTFATSSLPVVDLDYKAKSDDGGEAVTFKYPETLKDNKMAKASVRFFDQTGAPLTSSLAASTTIKYGIPSDKINSGGYLVVDLISHAGYYYQAKLNHVRFGTHTTVAFQIDGNKVVKKVPIDTSLCVGVDGDCVKQAIVNMGLN